MGIISLTIPVAGTTLFNTAAANVDSDLTIIQTLVNGQIDTTNLSPTAAITDAQLGAPVSAVRKLLLEAGSTLSNTASAGTYFFGPTGATPSGSGVGAAFPPVWAADSGLSSQPTDFQLSGRSSFGRLRVCALVNQVAPTVTFTVGLYPVSSTGTGSGSVPLNLGAVVSGSTVAVTTPAANSIAELESGQFALPTSAGVYVLGVNFSGTIAANSGTGIFAQLYGYNA